MATDYSPKAAAREFARTWYQRPGSGCDEGTLTMLLEDFLSRAHQAGMDQERERMLAKICQILEIVR